MIERDKEAMITLTMEMIDGLKTPRGGYTDATLNCFGLSNRNLTNGWRYKLIGSQFPEEVLEKAKAGSLIKAKEARRLKKQAAIAAGNSPNDSPEEARVSLLGEVISFLSHHGINPCGYGHARLAGAVAWVSTGISRRFTSKKPAKKYLRECRACGVFKQEFTREPEPVAPVVIRPVKAPTPPRPRTDPSYTRNKYLAMLDSQAWRELRIAVLLHYGRKCCLCGDADEVIQVDHIIPASVDWSRRLDFSNLQVLCRPCNLGKGNRYTEDWRR